MGFFLYVHSMDVEERKVEERMDSAMPDVRFAWLFSFRALTAKEGEEVKKKKKAAHSFLPGYYLLTDSCYMSVDAHTSAPKKYRACILCDMRFVRYWRVIERAFITWLHPPRLDTAAAKSGEESSTNEETVVCWCMHLR